MKSTKITPIESQKLDNSYLIKYYCKLDGKTIARFELELKDDFSEGFLVELGVEPEYRNLGIGSDLLNIIFGIFMFLNIPKIRLYVDCENEKAQRLYKRLGFSFEDYIVESEGMFCYRMCKILGE